MAGPITEGIQLGLGISKFAENRRQFNTNADFTQEQFDLNKLQFELENQREQGLQRKRLFTKNMNVINSGLHKNSPGGVEAFSRAQFDVFKDLGVEGVTLPALIEANQNNPDFMDKFVAIGKSLDKAQEGKPKEEQDDLTEFAIQQVDALYAEAKTPGQIRALDARKKQLEGQQAEFESLQSVSSIKNSLERALANDDPIAKAVFADPRTQDALRTGNLDLIDNIITRAQDASNRGNKQGLSNTFESVLSRQIERGEITFDEANEKLKGSQRKLFKVEIQDENGDTIIVIKDQEGNQIGNLGKAPKRTVEIKGASRLRQEFKKLPELKQFNEIELSFNKMLSALESGRKSGNFIATDQTLVTLFVKSNEPDSVVRVSEFARTGEAQSLVNRVIGLTQKQIQGGSGLLDEDRVELVKLASEFKRLAKEKLNKQRDFFFEEARLQNIDPSRLGPEFKIPLVTTVSTDEEIQAIFDETQRRNPGLPKEEIFNIMKGNR